MLHRDLKPANVFLCDGERVKLLDFGLAHLLGSQRSSSGGTPAYMAPEQARGEAVDARADVFALGVVLVEMLTGALPARVDAGPDQGARAGTPHLPGVPARIMSLVERMLAQDPAARPADGAAVLEALQEAQRARERRRTRARLGASTAVTAAVVAAGAWFLVNQPPAAPVVLAFADVVNETADAQLDAIGGLLAASVEQSQHVRVVTRTRMVEVLRAAGRGNVERVDERLGRDAAARTGSGALLLPTVRRFGDSYAIDVAALDPSGGDRLFSAKVDARGRDEIPALVDDLARLVLRRVAGRLAPSPRPVSATLTANLEASQRYFKGLQLNDQHKYDEGEVEFRRALEADPGFALARYQLLRTGWVNDSLPREELRAHLDWLLAHLDALRPRERELVLGMEEEGTNRHDAALERYKRLADAYPEDREPPYLVGESLFHRGMMDAAIPWYERALALDPAWPLPLTHLVMRLPPEEAVERARIAVRLFPGSGNHWALGLALANAGDRDGAAQAAHRMVELAPTDEMRTQAIPLLVYAERFAEAEAEVSALVDPESWDQKGRAALLGYQGRVREGLAQLDHPAGRAVYLGGMGDRAGAEREAGVFFTKVEKRKGGKPVWALREVATALAEVGAVEGADRAAGLLDPDEVAPVIRAAISGKRGDTEAALEALRALDARTRGVQAYFLGVLCAETGRDEEAVAALRRYARLDHSEFLYRSWALPKALYLLARSHERLGQRDEALAVLDRLFAMWRRPEPDLPLLAPAQALRARLAAHASR